MDANLPAETPESILAQLRAEPDLTEAIEADYLNRLVERCDAVALRRAILGRLGCLDLLDGHVVLRLLEAQLDPGLVDALAVALVRQPDLAPDRAWEALALLESSGQLDRHPDLVERWDELNDAIDPGDASTSLAEQLEEEPEGSWVALEGLGAIEPSTRCEIIASLTDEVAGPGLVAFLRILAFAHDDTTRSAALDALFDPRRHDEIHRQAWAELAADHFDPRVRERARRGLAIGGLTDAAIEARITTAMRAPARPRPDLVGSLVTAVDGAGAGSIVLASRDRADWVVASFACDVERGIVGVKGQIGAEPSIVAGFFDDFATLEKRQLIEDDPDLAVSLLAGAWLISGPSTNPALRFWIERTIGPSFQPRPVVAPFDADEVAAEALALLAEPSWAILEACPSWVDRSPLTFDLAESIILRGGDGTPDPRRDAGAFRYLFEHHLVGRLEHYRRLLVWMGSFWNALDETDLARSAVSLAWQLADPQNAVPGHPFIIALATQSLAAAQGELRRGADPRPAWAAANPPRGARD